LQLPADIAQAGLAASKPLGLSFYISKEHAGSYDEIPA
jgi:hypothetical protein